MSFSIDSTISVSGSSMTQNLPINTLPDYIVGENVTGTQTIPNGGTDVILTFDTIERSNIGLFSYNNGSFTITTPGVYRLDFSIIIMTGFIQNLVLSINSRLDGTNILGGSVRKQLPLVVNDTTTYGCSIPFTTTDTNQILTIVAINNGINDLTSDQMSSLSIIKIA